MSLDFPSNPVDGQVYDNFYWDQDISAWRSSGVLTPKLPAGIIHPYAGSTVPDGYLFCHGQEVLISTYPALYAAITSAGTVFPYGANTNGSGGVGTTHFRIPDLKGDVVVGRSTSGTFQTLGGIGGAESTSLTVNHIPQHNHSINHDHASFNTADGGTHRHIYFMDDGAGIYGPATRYNTIQYDATSSDAGNGGFFYTQTGNALFDGTHNHAIDVPAFTGTSGNYGTATVTPVSALQPYMVLNYIIKV